MIIHAMLMLFPICQLTDVEQAQQAEPPPSRYAPAYASKEELKAIYDDWELGLRAICEAEGIEAMVFDIEPAYAHIEPWNKRYGAEAMRLFAVGTKRRWLQIDGVQVFTRVGYNYLTNRYTETLHNLLRSLDEESIERLANEGVRLSELGSLRDEILPRLSLDPAMATVLVERGGDLLVQAAFVPQFEYNDPKTGARRIDQLGSLEENRPPRVSLSSTAGARHVPAPYDPHKSGPLDFGPGKVITIEEFKRTAEKQFATNYDIDARLMLAPVFVRGSMTKETFGKIYREIASAQHPVELERPPAPEEPSLAELLATTASPLADASGDHLYGLKPEDFVTGRTMTVGQLAALDPSIREQLAGLGLSPSDQVRLKPGVVFVFDAGGSRTLGFQDVNGRRIEYAASNRIRLGIR